MSFVPFLVLASTPEAVVLTGKIEASHSKLTKAAVYVWDGLSTAVPTKMSFSPSACRLEMPNQQIAEVRANEVRFYDEIFNQVASIKNPKPIKIPDAGSKVAIVQQAPIAWLLDSAQRSEFFQELKKDPRWKVKGSSLVLSDPKKKTLSEVQFDNGFRVTRIRLSISNKTVSDWRYRYVSESDIPTIPVAAKVVKGLPPRPGIPAKTDGKTVLFAQKIWRAMSRLEGKTLTQTTEEGSFVLSYGKGRMAESGPKGSWTMADTHMVVTPKNGTPRSFDGGSDRFLDVLRSKGIFVSPIARYVVNRQIPFLDMFDRTDEVKLINGVLKMDGQDLAVLSVKRSGIHIRMYVDPKTGLIAKVGSDATDTAGNRISGTQLRIKYQ